MPKDKVGIAYGGLRFDKYLNDGSVLTFEGGTTEYDGTVFISIPARGQIQNVKRPWARINYSSERWNVLAYWTNRDAEAVNLGSTNTFLMESDNYKLEFQTNRNFVNNKVRLVAGGSFLNEKVDSNIIPRAVDTDEYALFAQVDWVPNAKLKLVGALRWDDSTLHDSQVSPKASVVYSVSPKHTLRLTYNQAFQVPTYGEYFILGSFAGVDTGALNQICIVNGAGDCGLGGTTPATYSGNVSLDLEQVETIELGYKGILGSKTLLSVDLFESKNENFVTAFVPQLGPDGTRTNPNFGPWVGPDEAETTPIDPGDCPGIVAPGSSVADCVRAAAPLLPVGPGTLGGLGWQLTNAQDESIVLGLSYTNIGEVDTRGAEVGLNHFFDDRWSMFATYTWLDFEVVDVVEGLEGVIALNAPENKASLGASYVAGRWDASLRGRWVDSFRWFNPMTNGEVESFVTVDLTGNYMINESWKVGLNVANLFDEEHIEAWGADLVGRRALVNVTFAW